MIDLSRERPVSVMEVAVLFGVHRRTVEAWFHAGLEKRKLGGRVYTTREALDRFSRTEQDEPQTESEAESAKMLAAHGIKLGGNKDVTNGRLPKRVQARAKTVPVGQVDQR